MFIFDFKNKTLTRDLLHDPPRRSARRIFRLSGGTVKATASNKFIVREKRVETMRNSSARFSLGAPNLSLI